MRKSKVLSKIRSGGVAWLTNASGGPSPMICGLAAGIGFDGVWIDMEHRDLSYREVASMIMAIRERGADAVIRPRRSGPDGLYRLLEIGATGLVVPHCMNAEHAREIARNTRFAPIGQRGMETVCLDADYMMADAKEYFEFANRETFVCVQIEDREAVEDIQAIAAVEGVDGLFFGPGDLAQSYGIPLQFDHPTMREALERVAGAATEHGKIFSSTVATADAARPYLELGARLINVGGDVIILHEGWTAIKSDLDELTKTMGCDDS